MIRTVWMSSLPIAPLLLAAIAAEPAMAATDVIPASALIQPAQLAGELKAAPVHNVCGE